MKYLSKVIVIILNLRRISIYNTIFFNPVVVIISANFKKFIYIKTLRVIFYSSTLYRVSLSKYAVTFFRIFFLF